MQKAHFCGKSVVFYVVAVVNGQICEMLTSNFFVDQTSVETLQKKFSGRIGRIPKKTPMVL